MSAHARLLSFPANLTGQTAGRRGSDRRWRRKSLLVSGSGWRASCPTLEGVAERRRFFVAEQPRDLGKRHARIFQVLEREASPQLIDDVGIGRSLLAQTTREGSDAERHGPRDDLHSRFAVWQQLFQFIFHGGPERPFRRGALFRRRVAEGLK